MDLRSTSIAVKSKVSGPGMVEVGRLKKEDSEDEHNGVLANSLSGSPAWFLSTLTVHLAINHQLMKARPVG